MDRVHIYVHITKMIKVKISFSDFLLLFAHQEALEKEIIVFELKMRLGKGWSVPKQQKLSA